MVSLVWLPFYPLAQGCTPTRAAKKQKTTRGRPRGSMEADGALRRRLLSTQFLHEDGSSLVSTALDKSVLRLLVQCGGLFFSGPGPYLGL